MSFTSAYNTGKICANTLKSRQIREKNENRISTLTARISFGTSVIFLHDNSMLLCVPSLSEHAALFYF